MSANVEQLSRALRDLQTDYGLLVVSATVDTPAGRVTISFTGVSSPIGLIEDEEGNAVNIHAP